MTPVNGRLLFAANDGTNGYQIWTTDGINPAVRQTSFASMSIGSTAVTTSRFFFTQSEAASGQELYVSDGATVTLIDEARGTKLAPAVTDDTGTYNFPNVTAATYTVEVTLAGFKTAQRKARTARNPQTGAAIKIPKRRVVRFTAGKALKSAVNYPPA